MKLNDYQQLALRTASPREGEGAVDAGHDIQHAAYGFASEAGEFIDVLKKLHAYGKPIDAINLREEVGDILWYCAIACRGLGITLEDAASVNIAKLQKRFPNRFTQEEALTRDLTAERAVLESGEPLVIPSLVSPAGVSNLPTQVTLGTGMLLVKTATGWAVTSSGAIVAKTAGDGSTLIVEPESNEGPWLYAAQLTLDQILNAR